MRGKSPKEAAAAALAEAERLAGNGSWELIGVGRVYYLSGDKARGQALFDRVTGGKPKPSDWQRIGAVYAEAGENDRAMQCYDKVLALNPKDDTGRAEIGSWYIRIGQREKGEALLDEAMQRDSEDLWHYVRAAEAFLGVPAS
jgi:tetratricopeptide (TPR) repeat protein